MKLDHYDALMIFLCLVLFTMCGVFAGVQIEQIEHDAEIRKAQSIVKNCQTIISRSIYE